MVGYNPEPISGRELSSVEYSEAGLASGIATRAIIQPLDVLKIRFQLQEEPIGGRSSGKYRSVIQSVRLIAKEEGITAFWKGHVPAQGLSAIYGLVQFSSYEWLSRAIGTSSMGDSVGRGTSDFIAGGLSGSLAMTAAMPLDVIRTRLVAQCAPCGAGRDGLVARAAFNVSVTHFAYRGTFHAARKIVKYEGPAGFFRGWLPSVAQVAPFTGLQFWLYNVVNTQLEKLFGSHDSMNAMTSGATAGTLAKTMLYPLDMIRHRLQMNGFQREQSFGRTSDYSVGMMRSIKYIIKREGLRGLFKGIWPSQLKAAANSGCAFLFYELFCDILRWLVTAHAIALTLTKLFLGMASDRIQPRKLFIQPLVALAACLLALSFSSRKDEVFAVTILAAALQGAAWPVAVGYMQRWIPPSSIGVWFAVVSATTTIAGLYLTALSQFYWRTVAFNTAIATLVAAGAAYFIFEEGTEEKEDQKAEKKGAEAEKATEKTSLLSSLRIILASREMWQLAILYGLAMEARTIAETWLPLLVKGEEAASAIKYYFEIGGLLGSILSGVAVDALTTRLQSNERATRYTTIFTASFLLIVTSLLALNIADTESPVSLPLLSSLSFASGVAIYACVNVSCLAAATMSEDSSIRGSLCAIVSFVANFGSVLAGTPVAVLLSAGGSAALAPFLSLQLSFPLAVAFANRPFTLGTKAKTE